MILRPQMVAFQDFYSGHILAWRLDVSPNSTAVLLCAGATINDWDIPDHILLVNSREAAAKSITGGASTRYTATAGIDLFIQSASKAVYSAMQVVLLAATNGRIFATSVDGIASPAVAQSLGSLFPFIPVLGWLCRPARIGL